MNFIKDILKSDPLTRIISFNIIVFFCIHLIATLLFLFFEISSDESVFFLQQTLGVSSNIIVLLQKPWTIITYMFTHFDLFHVIINLFWLYFGGKIFISYIDSSNLLPTYIMGGFSGAILYILSFNFLPVFDSIKGESIAIGASASVLAILFASATYIPNFSIRTLFIGNIKLKYIALIALIIDILSIPKGNAGGHIAHIGGAFYGYLYIHMKNSKKINTNYLIDQIILIFTKKTPYIRKKENDYQYNARKRAEQKEIDNILDKISKSGYESLSNDEKQTLFNQKK